MSADPAVAAVERPVPAGVNAPAFGSDVVADTLRMLDIPYIALTPGASYRGLHDSLVNYLGNSAPQMLLCLHEESAVAIAHGYAKVTGKAMAAAVHANVGLFHATMALFNAWCDRMPMLVLGATGPVDAVQRRPWIDWIHTAQDQGALVRGYTKWDDQPASPGAAREALLRGAWIANTAPMGPVYINLDAGMQEAKLAEQLPPIDAKRYMPAVATAAPADLVREAAAMLQSAKQVVILAGRASRSEEAWNARVALAEALNASVVTDLKIGASFPTDHPLHAGAPRDVTADSIPALRGADVILSLDWVDLAGALRHAGPSPAAKIIQVSLDYRIHNGWSMDYEALPPVDLLLSADPDAVVPELLKALDVRRQAAHDAAPAHARGRSRARRLHQRAHRAGAARGPGRAAGDAHASADLLGGPLVDVPPPARLPRLRRRWRCRRRTGHFRRRGAGAEKLGPPAGRHLRRRRFSDGRHRAVDRDALQNPAALRHRQQSLVLQRRGPSGADGAAAPPSGRKQMDRAAHRRPGDRPRRARTRAGRRRLWPDRSARPISRRRCKARSPPSRTAAVAVVDVRIEPGYSAATVAATTRATKS